MAKFEDLRKYQYVYDRWWPWRLGCIKKVNKASIYIWWYSGTIDNWRLERYDKAHVQFLEISKK